MVSDSIIVPELSTFVQNTLDSQHIEAFDNQYSQQSERDCSEWRQSAYFYRIFSASLVAIAILYAIKHEKKYI
ncbi:MAG: hypothetical protein P0107_03340 [Nitrosomonas sp.]|nr:hypothetical protein [Nitrosomonas sp.]